MSQQYDELDDPELKHAVRRAFPAEAAPTSLRLRIESMLAAGAAPAGGAGSQATMRRRERSFWLGESARKTAVAAAVALIAVGFMVLQVRSHFFPPRPPPPVAATIPESFALEMVRTHEQCAKHPEGHGDAASNLDAVRAQLSEVEDVTVAAIEPGDGWTFRGGGTCDVGGVKTAHLIYQRNGQVASVFSMPAPSSCGGGRGYGSYQGVVQNHAVRGVINGGAVYCVVGSGGGSPLTVKDLEPFVAQVQDVCLTGCSPATPTP